MGEEDDPQRLKMIAASSYEYDRDPRWAEYWSNILIPPHMASRSDVVDHFKHKFYQRYLDPDFVVEPMPPSSSQPSKQSTSSSSFQKSQNDQGRSRSGSVNRGTDTPASTNSAPSMRWDGRTVQFSINAWVFVVAALALFPLTPRNLSYRAYRLAFMGTAASSLYSLYSLYGKPQAWNLQAVQTWFQPIIVAKDFIYSLYSLIFVGSSHLLLQFALIPVLCRSVANVAKFLRRNFSRSSLYRKYFEDPCVWVDSNATTLSILSSHAEVGIGFLLLISLFSWQRNIMQTFMYWQLLKLMYHAPATAGYHQSVWTKVGRTLLPLVHRYLPFLNAPISFLQRWWLR